MRKWLSEVILFGLYLAFGLSFLACAPLGPQLESVFHTDHAGVGSLISVVSLASALVPMLAGWLGARAGLTRSIGLGGLLCASSLSVPWLHSLPAALGARFMFGMGGGIVATLMGPMTMRLFQPRHWALVSGFNNVSFNVGVTLTLMGTLPLAHAYGWRQTLTGYGLLSLVLALAWWLVVQNQTLAEGTSGGYRQVLRRPSSWWLAVGFTGPLIAYLGLSSWLGQLLTQERGMSPEAASSLVGFLSLVGLPIAPLGGWLTTRLGLRRPFVIGCGLVLPLAGLGLIWLPHPYVWASLMGIAFQLYVSAFFTIPMELPGVSSASVGLTMGFVLSFAYLVSFGAPVLVGWSRDWSGHFLIGLSACVLCSATLALSGLCLPETGPGFLTPEPQDRALE